MISEAARVIGKSEDAVRSLFDSGKLVGFRTSGGVRVIDRGSLETYAKDEQKRRGR